MKNISRAVALLASVAVFAPVAGQAASLFTPSAKLVQKINNAYGTQFTAPGVTAPVATAHRSVTKQRG